MIISKKPPYSSTKADPEKTQMDITRLLREYGCSGVQWTTVYDRNEVKLAFTVEVEVRGVKKQLLVQVEPPIFAAKRRTWNPKAGRYDIVMAPNWAQSFRMLFWWLKAKLEAVAYGLTSFEKEFLSGVVTSLPDGRKITVGDAILNQVYEGRLALEEKAEPRTVESTVIEEGSSG